MLCLLQKCVGRSNVDIKYSLKPTTIEQLRFMFSLSIPEPQQEEGMY